MAKTLYSNFEAKNRSKRKGVHSKNASKSQNAYKKPSRGQGKR